MLKTITTTTTTAENKNGNKQQLLTILQVQPIFFLVFI